MDETKRPKAIHYIICAAFCLLFRFVPGFAGITPLGMGILGSFIGAVYGWLTIDMLWPSLLALLGAGLSIGMNQMLAASFGNLSVVSLIICMGAVGLAMSNGAFNWVAMKLLSNRFMAGKGWLTILVVFLAAWLTGSFNPIIMCIIFCAFLTSMFKQVGVPKNDKLVIFTFLGVAYQLMRGQILFPFMGTGLVYLMAYNNMFPGRPIDMVHYLTMMILMGFIMVFIFILLMKYVFRVDVSPLSNYRADGKAVVCKKEQKIALILFVVFIIANILAALPLGPVSTFLQKFGIIGIGILLAAAVPFFTTEEGEPVGDLEKLFGMVNWGQITLVGYIMVLSQYMNTPDTGISQAMALVLTPFTQLPPLVFIVVVMVVATVLTNIANNMIVTVLCMPFLVNFGTTIGMEPAGMVCLLFIISEFALATPAASPVTAVAMTQEMVSSKEMTKGALKLLPILFLCFMVVAWPLAMVIF